MARPSKFDREQVVEFAMNAFWKEGYEANSVKALSEKLGITRSSFYNAFGDREQLFDEALALYMRDSPDKAFREAAPGISIKALFTDTFRAVCKVRTADIEARGCLVVNGVAELCGTHDTIGPKLQAAMLANLKRFETLLQGGVDKGELDTETDVHALALAVETLLIGLNVLSKLVHDEDALWQSASTSLRALNLLEGT